MTTNWQPPLGLPQAFSNEAPGVMTAWGRLGEPEAPRVHLPLYRTEVKVMRLIIFSP